MLPQNEPDIELAEEIIKRNGVSLDHLEMTIDDKPISVPSEVGDRPIGSPLAEILIILNKKTKEVFQYDLESQDWEILLERDIILRKFD